jgi:tRNA 2-selenouridine synthase
MEIVVYCWRGGKRSFSLNTILNSIGLKSNIISGGYKSFRKLVIEKLETLPKNYKFVVIAGPTGNGKTLLLEKLEKSGENIINLEKLANHYGSVLGDINLIQPTQKSFETHLLYSLSKLDAKKICFIESESKKIGKLSIPDILLKKIRNSTCIQIEIPIDSRLENIKENYKYFIDNPNELLIRLKKIKQYIGVENLNNWIKLINHYEWDAFIEQIITTYYDPLYNKSLNQNYSIDFKIQSNKISFKENINFIFDKIMSLKDKL